jgi:hypothetical protein
VCGGLLVRSMMLGILVLLRNKRAELWGLSSRELLRACFARRGKAFASLLAG